MLGTSWTYFLLHFFISGKLIYSRCILGHQIHEAWKSLPQLGIGLELTEICPITRSTHSWGIGGTMGYGYQSCWHHEDSANSVIISLHLYTTLRNRAEQILLRGRCHPARKTRTTSRRPSLCIAKSADKRGGTVHIWTTFFWTKTLFWEKHHLRVC